MKDKLKKLFSTMQEDVAMSHHLSDTYLIKIEEVITEALNNKKD